MQKPLNCFFVLQMLLLAVSLGNSVKQAIDSTMYNLSFCLSDYNKKFGKVPESLSFTEKSYNEIINGIAKSNIGNYNIYYVYSSRVEINNSIAETILVAIASDKIESAEHSPEDRIPIITYNETSKKFSSYRVDYSRLVQYLSKSNKVDFLSNLSEPDIKKIVNEKSVQKSKLLRNNTVLGPDSVHANHEKNNSVTGNKVMQKNHYTKISLAVISALFGTAIIIYVVRKIRKQPV